MAYSIYFYTPFFKKKELIKMLEYFIVILFIALFVFLPLKVISEENQVKKGDEDN